MNSVRGLQPWLMPYAEYLVYVANHYGWSPTITSTYRSRSAQARLYARYLSGASRFPAAPPGRSYHEYGRAFDLKLNDMSKLGELGELWRSWGGSWWASDPIHFQV